MTKTKQDYQQIVKQYSAVAMLLFFIILNSLFTPNFFRMGTLNNIITQICPTVLCGMGMTLVISTGGIDISVGSVMALAGVMTAKLMPETGLVPAILLAVAASVLVGCIAGFFVGVLDLQAMVITLGLMLGVRGAAQVLCDGRDIYFNKLGDVGEQLSLLGTYKIGGIVPVQIIPILIFVVAVWIIVEKTVFGRQIQAVGDNIKSSALAGINTSAVMMAVYGFSGFCAAFAGIFMIMLLCKKVKKIKVVSYLGRYSIITLSIHGPILHFLGPLVSRYIHNSWAQASALLLITLSICLLLTPVFLKVIPQMVAQKDLLKVKQDHTKKTVYEDK